MLIVAGHLVVAAETRDAYVAQSADVVRAALEAPGCIDFSITSDPMDPQWIRIFERWEDESHLLAFRGSSPSGDQQAQVLDSDVKRYTIAAIGDP